MVYGDRFFVGAMVGANQLPEYAIPQEALQRLLLIPAALCGALMPRLSALGRENALGVYRANFRRVALWMAVICGVVAAVSHPAFSLWISPSFADSAITVTLILALGIWINSMALVPYTVMHALGKPKTTALFHVLELAVYLAMLWPLVHYFGLTGAAIAWTIRIALDCILLHGAAKRAMNGH
jgi:O-antigen/teichoic acid export membrane protein